MPPPVGDGVAELPVAPVRWGLHPTSETRNPTLDL